MIDADGKDIGSKSGSVEWAEGLTIDAGTLSQPMTITPQKGPLTKRDKLQINRKHVQYLLGTVEFSIAEQQFDTKAENCKDTVGDWDQGDGGDRMTVPKKHLNNRKMNCRFKC